MGLWQWIKQGHMHSNGAEEWSGDVGKKRIRALAGVARWIELWPANRGVASLIPGWGTCQGCGPGPGGLGCVWEAITHWCCSPSPPSLPLSKINILKNISEVSEHISENRNILLHFKNIFLNVLRLNDKHSSFRPLKTSLLNKPISTFLWLTP